MTALALNTRPSFIFAAVCFTTATACAKPYQPPADEGTTDCVPSLEPCGEDEAGQDEGSGVTSNTGDTTGSSEATPLASGTCVANDDPSVQGYRHQCEGTVDFSIEFDIPLFPGKQNCIDMQNKIPDHQLCTESHAFGSEPYEMAQVANCCGPWDGDPANEDTYLGFCEADLANQLCHTLVARMTYHLDNNHFPGFEDQAQAIINEISSQIGKCTGQFLENDSNPSPGILDSFFKLQNSDAWPTFLDFTIEVKIGDISGFSVPADPVDWIECSGMQGNDGDIFPKPQGLVPGTPHDALLASPMVALLAGPPVFGAPVSGQATIGSVASACVDPWCSAVAFTLDASAGEWALESMELFAASSVSLSNGLGSYELADVRLTLADLGPGYIEDDATHVIDAGEAQFWILGRAADDPTSVERFLASTSTDIQLTQRPRTQAWQLSAFGLEYIDYEGGVWTVVVPASTWE